VLVSDLPRGFTTRFAPAPTGHLHLGHVVNAIWVWGVARAFGGRVLLRIEDHDRGRCRPEYEAALREDLAWLGFVPDVSAVLRQSDNVARYTERLAELERAQLAYACTCSRSEIARANGDAAEGEELRYPGTCRAATKQGETPARRIVVTPGLEAFADLRLGSRYQEPEQQCGDVLARDRNGNFTYQFAVCVDDIDQGVDVVIRGEDLLSSTGRQIRIARLLGRAQPPRFLHHPLVRHENGQKLSKSAGDTGVRELRASGASAADVLGRAALVAGVAHDGSPITVAALAQFFR
jgi:glutamyl-Q tRNA(Asp) synthetase